MKWSENDKLFFDEARKGQRWQEYVGQRLAEAGFKTQVHGLELRDNIEQAGEYKDQEDIWVWTPSGTKLVIECKSRDLSFTSPETFPFDAPMVDTESSWEKKGRKPDLYVCVSQRTGAIIALSKADRSHWFTKQAYDSVRRIRDTWLCCHKKHWYSFETLVEALQEI